MRLLSALVRIPVRITFELARRAASAAGVTGHADERGTPVRVPPQPDYFRPPEPPRSEGNGGAPPDAPEPVHVSEEPVLVAEVAEEGAEDGAGAEVRVNEPWPGYNRMTAADIRERLRSEPTEVAAAVSLYEAAGKGRSSVLEAAGRSMRLSGRPSG